MTTTKYSLRHKATGELIRWSATSQALDNIQVELDTHGAHEWFIDEAWKAEYARLVSTVWYNSDIEHPQHGDSFNPDDYEVAKIVITVDVEPFDVRLPSTEEWLEFLKTHWPVQYNELTKLIAAAKQRDPNYPMTRPSFFDISDMFRNGWPNQS